MFLYISLFQEVVPSCNTTEKYVFSQSIISTTEQNFNAIKFNKTNSNLCDPKRIVSVITLNNCNAGKSSLFL